ncbi:hypothetical protein OSB04_031652 [Centaurea solstitialis]|uniref:cytochrome-b5 reductase n=1 Tax=Centaurea solstitialis TaxID=347529 RepID=A0AA38S9D8_9ASTR|nr:hypothetical protein OSB04_031652 [Centaurea solstitialis]
MGKWYAVEIHDMERVMSFTELVLEWVQDLDSILMELIHLDQINEETGPKTALNPDKWIEFKLQEKAKVSHNTQLYRSVGGEVMNKPWRSATYTSFLLIQISNWDSVLHRALLQGKAPLGEDAEGKTKYVVRPYTPISDPDSEGYFDLMIKIYPEGKMSQHFAKLKPGDVLEVKGPIEKIKYTPNMKKHIGMIAGGSGITPMLQVIEAILKNPDDNTKVSLIYANVSPDDILLKKKLDMLAASHPNLKVFYTVDNPSKYWVGGTGYISKDMASKGLPAPSDDTLVLPLTMSTPRTTLGAPNHPQHLLRIGTRQTATTVISPNHHHHHLSTPPGLTDHKFNQLKPHVIQFHSPSQCSSLLAQHVHAPAASRSVVRRFDKAQTYKHFIKSCIVPEGFTMAVGCTRDVNVISGLPADTTLERLDLLDDRNHVMAFTIIGGEHRLKNYHAVTTVHEVAAAAEDMNALPVTVVLESYVVDVPEGNTEDTRLFADTVVKQNLQKLVATEAMVEVGGDKRR